MSTATLSKKERKQLRKQMLERKAQLRAKHGRSGSRAAAAADPPPGGSDHRPTGFRALSQAKVEPRPTPPSWTPPPQPAPHRTLTRHTPKPTRTDPGPTPAAVVHLDDPGPGPLTRAAAFVETSARRGLQLWRDRPWQDAGEVTRAESHRALSLLIPPLRTLGLVMIGGAVVLGRESRDLGATTTGSLVFLGVGLALAVVLLGLAELAAGLRTVLRRLQ
jgi:hypothetical protein